MLPTLLAIAALMAQVYSAACPSKSSSRSQQSSIIDSTRFASTEEIRHLTDRICGAGLRLPGSATHLKVVDFIECQLSGMPGITVTKSDFDLANWEPEGNSLYHAARLQVGNTKVDVVGAIAYSLPTNGSYVSGPLMYVDAGVDLSTLDLKGKIVMRDYTLLAVPAQLIAGSSAYFVSPNATTTGSYTRPYLTPPNEDMLAASLGGAAGYISAFNVSRAQLEGYYSGHAGVHWLVPGVFTGAEQYSDLREAATNNMTASIRIDAKTDTVKVPRLMATLPGQSDETIVVATHTDGDTYVQENGPVALLALARYFASLPTSSRQKTLKFAFEASHLAYQLDSDKLLAKALNANYDNANDTTAFVVAVEHLGTREIEMSPATDGSPGNVLNYTGKGEALLWSIGPVENAVSEVVKVATNRNLDNTVVAPGFPPANTTRVPSYFNMGGLGTYYHAALLPTMALISGPWSLWAPSFGADAIDYERLRLQHMAIGDAILALSSYSKEQLRGNYTKYRQRRANGADTNHINYDTDQFITSPDGVYF